MRLDKKAKQLLGILNLEGRMSLADVSKRLEISKETAGYRIKQLVKNDFITSFSITVNGALLGYRYNKILIKFSRVTPTEEQDVIDYLLSTPGVTTVRVMEGVYDLSFIFMSKSFSNLRDFLNSFTKLHGDQIIKRHILILSKIHNYTHSYFMIEDKNRKAIIYSLLDRDNGNLDLVDIKLLQEFSKDCRVNLLQLSRKTEIKRTTLLYHKKKLDENIIVAYNSHINFNKLKLICVHINLSLFNISDSSSIITFFNDLGVCTSVYEMIGDYDLSVELLFKTNEERRNIMHEFKKRFVKKMIQYDITDVPYVYNGGWSPFSFKDSE